MTNLYRARRRLLRRLRNDYQTCAIVVLVWSDARAVVGRPVALKLFRDALDELYRLGRVIDWLHRRYPPAAKANRPTRAVAA